MKMNFNFKFKIKMDLGEDWQEREYQREYDPYEEYEEQGYFQEQPEFAADYSQLQYVDFSGRVGTKAKTKIEKMARTQEEVINDVVDGILSGSPYNQISKKIYRDVKNSLELLKCPYFYNLELLVVSLIFINSGIPLERKELSEFSDKFSVKGNQLINLVRYVRHLQKELR